MTERSNYILAVVTDVIADFLYYDRKEDDQLPRGEIEKAIEAGEITIEQIVEQFEKELRRGIK